MRRWPLALALVLSISWAQSPDDDPLTAAGRVITAEALRAHIRFLSDSLLEGRETGSRGYNLAALYVATQLERIGVTPAGDQGGWYQQVPMRKARIVETESSLRLAGQTGERTLMAGQDYVFAGDLLHTESVVDAPVVFVGFGVTAPELHYDDFAGADVNGKVVAFLMNAPATFPSTERAYYSDSTVKARNAVAHGAVGILTMLSEEEAKRLPWPLIRNYFGTGQRQWVGRDGVPHNTFPELRFTAVLSPSGTRAVLEGARIAHDEILARARAGQPQSVPLAWTVQARTTSTHETLKSANVVGMLRGSDPRLASEYVVFSAHLDHIGKCDAVNGDDICHGAVDNASGVATLIETAAAFRSLPRMPRRSLVFLFVTGEEGNLEGSDYFAQFPTVAADGIVADLNADGTPGIFRSGKDVVACGSEHSSLAQSAERAAKRAGYELSPDPIPEENIFIRGDHYSFVLRGIPALYFFDGTDGIEALKTYLTTKYHTPLDNMDQPLDFEAAARATRLNFLLGWDVAEQNEAPAWNKDDFFGNRFGRPERQRR